MDNFNEYTNADDYDAESKTSWFFDLGSKEDNLLLLEDSLRFLYQENFIKQVIGWYRSGSNAYNWVEEDDGVYAVTDYSRGGAAAPDSYILKRYNNDTYDSVHYTLTFFNEQIHLAGEFIRYNKKDNKRIHSHTALVPYDSLFTDNILRIMCKNPDPSNKLDSSLQRLSQREFDIANKLYVDVIQEKQDRRTRKNSGSSNNNPFANVFKKD